MKKDGVDLNLFKQSNLRSVLGFIISGFLLWLTFYKSGLHLYDITLKGEQFYYFLTAIALLVFSLWLYSVRAKMIWLNKIREGAVIYTYSSLILGNFYNSILPGNLGEGVRAWHFSRKNRIPFSRALAALITEKWLDAQVFAVLVVVLFLVKPFMNHYVSYVLAYTALAVLIFSIIHSVMRRNKCIEKSLWRLALSFKKIGRFLFRTYSHTNGHLRNMKDNGAIIYYVILFMAIFILNALQFFCLLKAAGVAEPVGGLYSSFLISLSMMIIAFIPSAPSSIGVLHYGVFSALILSARQYGIEPNTENLQSYALFGVYAHLSYFIPEVLLGLFFVVKEKKFLFDALPEATV